MGKLKIESESRTRARGGNKPNSRCKLPVLPLHFIRGSSKHAVRALPVPKERSAILGEISDAAVGSPANHLFSPIVPIASVTPLSSSTQRIDPPRLGPQQPVAVFATAPERTSRAGQDEFRRIDHAHQQQTSRGQVSRADADENAVDPADRDDWLRLQARDLIERLQRWSADLDARQAQLNAAMAQQDVRERQFRIRQQESAAELDRQQEAIDALRIQLSAQARRLAFQIS